MLTHNFVRTPGCQTNRDKPKSQSVQKKIMNTAEGNEHNPKKHGWRCPALCSHHFCKQFHQGSSRQRGPSGPMPGVEKESTWLVDNTPLEKIILQRYRYQHRKSNVIQRVNSFKSFQIIQNHPKSTVVPLPSNRL